MARIRRAVITRLRIRTPVGIRTLDTVTLGMVRPDMVTRLTLTPNTPQQDLVFFR
jgi:hypothetical protein